VPLSVEFKGADIVLAGNSWVKQEDAPGKHHAKTRTVGMIPKADA
jgi:hypothetical protein